MDVTELVVISWVQLTSLILFGYSKTCWCFRFLLCFDDGESVVVASILGLHVKMHVIGSEHD